MRKGKAVMLSTTTTPKRQRVSEVMGVNSGDEEEEEDVEAPGTSIDKEIQQRQWAHMRSLAQEWERKAGMGVLFILCNHSLSREFTQAKSTNNWCL